MNIGVFDSGLGGLIVTRELVKSLPEYDFVYLGDTKRVPYGNRSEETIYEFTRSAVEHLFTKKKCSLIIVACNTASARALRRVQREYLAKYFPNRRVLGVIIPTAEELNGAKKIGVLATAATVRSGAFVREIKKVNRKAEVFQNPAPLLVPLIEQNALKHSKPFLEEYLKPLLKKKIDTLVLGCTHYPILKNQIKKAVGQNVKVISQADIIPKKLKDYLRRHSEIERKLSKNSKIELLVTDKTEHYESLAKSWFGKKAVLKKVVIKANSNEE
jgi:glutamate racemase